MHQPIDLHRVIQRLIRLKRKIRRVPQRHAGHLSAQHGAARFNAGSSASTSAPKPGDERRRMFQVGTDPHLADRDVRLGQFGIAEFGRAKTPASTWRISSATRNCRCDGRQRPAWFSPVGAPRIASPSAAFLKPEPSPSRSTRPRRLPADRGSWRTTGRTHSRARPRAHRP